jgi:hypothetical protein
MREVDGNRVKEPDEQDGHDNDESAASPSDKEIGEETDKKKGKGKRNRNTSKKKEKRRKKNRGKLILDATVAPADIKYPTDIHLLNKCREHLETAINVLWKVVPHTGHKLPYSAKKARKAYLKLAKSKKWTKAKCRKGIGEQLRYIELATKRLNTLKEQVPSYRKQLAGWLLRRLEVIPLVYLQQ